MASPPASAAAPPSPRAFPSAAALETALARTYIADARTALAAWLALELGRLYAWRVETRGNRRP